MNKIIAILLCQFLFVAVQAQDIRNNPGSNHGNRFEKI